MSTSTTFIEAEDEYIVCLEEENRRLRSRLEGIRALLNTELPGLTPDDANDRIIRALRALVN